MKKENFVPGEGNIKQESEIRKGSTLNSHDTSSSEGIMIFRVLMALAMKSGISPKELAVAMEDGKKSTEYLAEFTAESIILTSKKLDKK